MDGDSLQNRDSCTKKGCPFFPMAGEWFQHDLAVTFPCADSTASPGWLVGGWWVGGWEGAGRLVWVGGLVGWCVGGLVGWWAVGWLVACLLACLLAFLLAWVGLGWVGFGWVGFGLVWFGSGVV